MHWRRRLALAHLLAQAGELDRARLQAETVLRWASADGADPAELPGERLRAFLADHGARFLDGGMTMSVPEKE